MSKWYYIIIFVISITLISSLIGIIKYNNLLSERSLYSIAGAQENYTLSIAKFSIQLNDFYALVSNKNSAEDIELSLNLLLSNMNIIRNKSDSTAPLYSQEGYNESINAIYNELSIIDKIFYSSNPDVDLIKKMILKIRPMTKNLLNIADDAEVTQRTCALLGYKKKIKNLWILIIITTILLATLLVVLVFFIRQSHRLLISEKAAFTSKNAFLGIVGHELRTSLQIIISAIDAVTGMPSEKIRQEALQRLVMAVAKMERQMKDLTEFAKIDNGYVDIKYTYFQLRSAITETVQTCISLYNKEYVKVSINNEVNAVVFTDMVRLNQLVENLVSNAIKYTDSGKVDIDYFIEKDKWLVITVSDTGKGIPKDKLKYIFKPFVRLGDNKKPVPGFGMGLAIVNGILRVLKGNIQIQSTVGTGTIVTLRLPVKVGDNALLEHTVPLMKISGNTTSNIRLLVVDDNEMACASLATLLENFGYIVDSAITPERAYEKLLRKSYDIVLSDLQMPVMTGAELYYAVRQKPNPNRNTPFIFVSAYGDESPVVNVPLLTKPVRFQEINKAINNLLVPNRYISQ